MKTFAIGFLSCVVAFVVLLPGPVNCQQINVSTPFNSASSSFHERFGVNFGFSLAGGTGNGSRVVGLNQLGQITPNINFSQNSSGAAIPAFGGFDPNSGARFGISRRSSNGSGFSLGFDLSQGSTRTLTSTTPSVTILNGGIGSIASGFSSPFVTGVTPVVGSVYQPDNAVTRGISSGQLRPYSPGQPESKNIEPGRLPGEVAESSATQGDISVAEIKAQKKRMRAAKKRELQLSIQQATTAAEAGDYRLARINLRKAIKLTTDATSKQHLKARLKAFNGK